MRVLMVSDVFFPRINGVSTSIETFSAGLARQGVEVHLVAPAYGDEPPWPRVIRVPARPVPFDPEDRFMSVGAVLDAVDAAGLPPWDLVHVQTPFSAHYAGLRLARRSGVPVVATYHTLFEEYLHHYVPLLPRRLTATLARRFSARQCNDLDGIIVPSHAMVARLLKYGVTRPLHLLPTGLAAGQFVPGNGAAFRARHGIAPGRPLGLYVGRVAHEKNIGFLIEVAERVRRRQPDFLLLVAGEGPAREALAAQVRKTGLEGHVQFVGYLERRRELLDCYAAADVFVFASRTETQGLVLLEAMAQGVPVVGLAEMGARDILGPERGARVAPPEIEGFADTVADLLADPAARHRLGRAASAFAAEWGEAGMAERLAAIYRAVRDNPAAPGLSVAGAAAG